MYWFEILKVFLLFAGILAAMFGCIFVVYHVFMAFVSRFSNSVSYNVYRPFPSRKIRIPPKS